MKYIIVGAGGHSKVVIDILRSEEKKILGIIDDRVKESSYIDIPILGTTDDLSKVLAIHPSALFIVAIGHSGTRQQIVEKLKCYNVEFGRAVHSTAVIGSDVVIGMGTVIMPNVVVNAGTVIGEHVIMNTASTIDHECIINDYVHISPGAHLAGNVTVGSSTHIGIGSSLIQGITVGSHVVVGAGSCVIRNIRSNVVAVGCPAKEMKSNE